VRPQADVKGVALEVNASDGLSVVAAPGDLRQIFSNLVVNALNATNRGGRVLVHAAAANDDVRAAVSDTGQGIPADVCERIFEPFFTTNTKTGVGLGLFVVQELVTKNGGTVRCQSSTRAEDHGTTFTITLPRAHAHKAAAAS
jgi:signal transduction histidine kinase